MSVLKLGPRYRIVDEIASGGMGAVVLALRTGANGNTPVAIKKMHAHLVDSTDIVASFVDEARIASRIHHPNVVSVYDVEMVGDELMIVMDYVEGIPLRELLRVAKGTLPLDVIRRILADALQGLHAAHELKDERGAPLEVVHRDVSPHNLLVGTNGVTRVADFGIAIAAGRIASTTDGALKGKLLYLTPEQIFRSPVDRRTDVFAAGIVLWEALTGRKLFDGGTEAETLAMVLRAPIVAPSTYRPEVPPALDALCLEALARDAQERFASAAEFARALEHNGPLATPAAVGALVLEHAGRAVEMRRKLLAAPPPPTSRPSIPDVTADAIADPDSAVLPPRTGKRSTAMSAIALLIVASICVSIGLLVGSTVRKTDASSPRDTASTIPSSPALAVSTTPAPPSAMPSASVADVEPKSPSIEPKPAVVGTSIKPTTTPTNRAATRGGGARRDAGAHGGRPFMPSDL